MPRQSQTRPRQSPTQPAACNGIFNAEGMNVSAIYAKTRRSPGDLASLRHIRDDKMGEMSLRMVDGTHIVVPSSLGAITTYVILEQEKWFEKEIAFVARWLRPGMTAIDIGANLGVYSLPMARLVGPEGQVFAYEPATETRRLLAISKAKNGADNLHIIA